MKLRSGITLKLTLVLVLFAAALLSGLGVLAYNNGREALEAATKSELLSRAMDEEAALNYWVDERLSDVIALADTPSLIESLEALTAAKPGTPQAQAAHEQLVRDLQARTGPGQPFMAALVIEPVTGQVIAATNPDEEGKFKETLPYFINGLNGPYIQNVYYSTPLQGPAMTVATPMRAADGRLLGVLAGRLYLEEMKVIILRRSGVHQTDDAFLVNTSNLFVTQPRLVKDPAILSLGVHSEAVIRCLKHNSGLIMAEDYRGIPAMIAYRWLPERQLCLIVKMDQAEALAPILALRNNIFLISILVLITASFLAWWLARTITRPLKQLAEAAQEIGSGKLETRIEVKTADEIGQLAGAFIQMTGDLQKTLVSRDDLLIEVTERKRVEDALVLEKNKLSAAFETANTGFVISDGQGENIFMNATALEFHGFTSSADMRRRLGEYAVDWELRYPDGRLMPFEEWPMSRAVRGDYVRNFETYVLNVKSGYRWIGSYSAVPVRNSAGEVTLIVMTIFNITERKRAEEKLNKTLEDLARSNTELERFAYVASHDLQEPLRMVTSYLQLLERRYKDKLDGDALEFINFAVDGSKRMKTLINDLLAYSRVGTRGQEFAPIDCEKLLAQVLTSLHISIEENKARVTHDPLPMVMADEAQLESLFQNLIGNAIKFRGRKPPRIHVGVKKDEKDWIFSVSDNGIGIDPQYFERIFIIFQRLHNREEYPGTGIGLAISKRIVERHGGRIWIESQPQNGSTFFFTLPTIGEPQ